ncbi:MAG: metalloregulator ArsR/SmtB family transcription factor [Acidimicrobiales bacterium]
MPPQPSPGPVFAALADPTRREIFETLARTGSGTATALTSAFGISRQAIAKHLSLLNEAGLTSATRAGRETVHTPQLEPLHALTDWVAVVEGDWSRRLGALSDYVTKACETT